MNVAVGFLGVSMLVSSLAACGDDSKDDLPFDGEPRSGARLKLRWHDFEGERLSAGAFDTERGAACTPSVQADRAFCGDVRLSLSEPQGPGRVQLIYGDSADGARLLVTAYDRQLGAPCQLVEENDVTRCEVAGQPPTSAALLFRVLDDEPAPRLQATHYTDGTSLVPGPTMRDMSLRTSCLPTEQINGSIRCIPTSKISSSGRYFTDHGCGGLAFQFSLPPGHPLPFTARLGTGPDIVQVKAVYTGQLFNPTRARIPFCQPVSVDNIGFYTISPALTLDAFAQTQIVVDP